MAKLGPYVVADEHLAQLREDKEREYGNEMALRRNFFLNGGRIKKCPPFTPGGIKRFDRGSRPERGLITTPEGIKLMVKGDNE